MPKILIDESVLRQSLDLLMEYPHDERYQEAITALHSALDARATYEEIKAEFLVRAHGGID